MEISTRSEIRYADEYVTGMWEMLQHNVPETFVLATGVSKTVRDFVITAGKALGIEIEFQGEGAAEIGIDRDTGKRIAEVNPEFYRPAEVDLLIGDSKKAEKELGWRAQTSFESVSIND